MLIPFCPARPETRADRYATGGGDFCSFGITEFLVATLVSAGIGAETAGIVAPALLGAGGGALTAGITGGDPLLGAAGGALTGGAIGGFGGQIGTSLGIGATAGDVVAGAGAGALSSTFTGQSPLTAALTGGASGLVAGLSSGGNAPGVASEGSPSSFDVNGATVRPGAIPSADSIALSATPTTGVSGATAAAAPAPAGVTAALGATPFDLTTIGTAPAAGFTDAVPPIDAGAAGGSSFAPSADTIQLASAGTGATATDAGGGLPAGGGGGFDVRTGGAPAGLPGDVSATNFDFGAAPNIKPALGGALEAPLGSGGAAPAGTGTGSGSGSAASLLQDLGVGPSTSNIIGKNLGPLVAAGGLGASLLTAPSGVTAKQTSADISALTKQAGDLAAAGTANQGYLQSGTLPPGAQAAVSQATQAAKAHVRSQFSSLGLTGSTMEAQALNNIESQAAQQVFDIGNKLVSTGLTQTQLSNQLYEQLISLGGQQTASTQSAIAALAASLSGGGTTIKLAA